LVLVNERQLDFQFAVPEGEDSYFTIAFSIAICAGRFGGGDARSPAVAVGAKKTGTMTARTTKVRIKKAEGGETVEG
jgi:hypothetical protein